ncbi:uncharacterized protein PpBr36_09927 [Pyricularia pennisetigena]|uniref:uncharacterized protein n=1 Tax=Pyricularia pennisetigena TaxID=1578925 RepID=UPI0011540C6B|nr:uncharacterized protein PpBr36_09927 [Pyricularia pennisetigena]TLS22374.1 hypothetical protein PpBr36_09927 [Pyricularia pennisetigena]
MHTMHGCFFEEDVSLFDAPFFAVTGKDKMISVPDWLLRRLHDQRLRDVVNSRFAGKPTRRSLGYQLEGRDVLMRRYGVPASRSTPGLGVVFNSQPEHGASSLQCLADFGVYVDISNCDDALPPTLPRSISHASIQRVDVHKLMAAKPVLAQKLFANVTPFSPPSPLNIRPAAEAKAGAGPALHQSRVGPKRLCSLTGQGRKVPQKPC